MPLPPPPPAAQDILGNRLDLVARYGDLLATDAVVRGLIGPRETERLWDRHLLNCALVADLLPTGARVVDVGSGAGLPGLVLACVRPDLSVDLVDSLARRTAFLTEAVTILELTDRVRVVTGRAEERSVVNVAGRAAWVTARAVAPLDRLARWCLPLLASGGTLLAMKGAAAIDEIAAHSGALRRQGARSIELALLEQEGVPEPVRVVRVVKR